MRLVLMPVPVGELIDRITILEIRREFVPAVGAELETLIELAPPVPERMYDRLRRVNRALWKTIDAVRSLPDGRLLMAAARDVIRLNDDRRAIIREISGGEL